MTRILALCGSLRGVSKNRQALQMAQALAPPGCEIVLWDGLASLPAFSPDLDQPGQPVQDSVAIFHAQIAQADGLLIACPEYAHGLPGAFKNALDWLVGSVIFPGKPVGLLTIAPHAAHAPAQLREVLVTMSAAIVEDACCAMTFPRSEAPDSSVMFETRLRAALDAFAARLEAR